MFTLFHREINNYFNSLIGIIVVAVFLIITGLFLWVFPGGYNILSSGFANLSGLFNLAPYVFLFIIPAITMRFFADENKAGTIEMLLTKPVTDMQIILSKWMAGCVLVIIILLPTMVYYLTVSEYAFSPGLDVGGTWGSYIGLLLLGAVFVSIGLFASSLTDNQIISFVTSLFLSGFAFIGFELIHSFGFFGRFDLLIRDLGIQAHYESISRGVIDTRDVVYYVSLIVFFLLLTKIKLESRRWCHRMTSENSPIAPKGDLRKKHLTQLLVGLLLLLLLHVAGGKWFVRIDLTAEKRHSLTPATRQLLRGLDDIVYFRVYLEGDFPAGFKRLSRQTREVLDEFRAYSDMIQYQFINPARVGDRQQVQDYYEMLADKGLQPTQIQVRADDAASQQLIFPGAIASYKGKELPLQILQDQLGLPPEEVLNNSAQLLEYTLANTIKQLATDKRHIVGVLDGYGTLDPRSLHDITRTLQQYYQVERVGIDRHYKNIQHLTTLIIAKPREAFSEGDKFIIDQFVMHGGAVLWLIDPVFAEMDSLQHHPHHMAGIAWPLNLEDMLFRYGVRLNSNLLQDLQSAPIPVTTGFMGDRPQISLIPWPFFPLLTPASAHPVVRNLNLVRSEFASSLDTIEVADIKKTMLLKTSPYTRIMPTPAHIALSSLQDPIDERLYSGPPQAVAALLEGHFQSIYTNRLLPDVVLPEGFQIKTKGLYTSMIVVGDGDVIKNQINNAGQIFPLGYDRYSGESFGNKDFVLNAVNYLTDDTGIMGSRTKEIRLRMLDKTRMNQHALTIQLINVLAPVVIVLIFGMFRIFWRNRHYSR